MKRSEALKLLINAVYLSSRLDIVFDTDEADVLLKYIQEEIGMVPPAITSDIYLRADCEYAQINEWEIE